MGGKYKRKGLNMKKLFLALLFLTLLSLPAFASVRVAGSLDLGDIEGDIGVSAHALFSLWTPLGGAIEVGPGASFWIPLHDFSELAVYASGLIYPLKLAKLGIDWYLRLNLGFNVPIIGDGSGGLYYGVGTGYDITKMLFLEVLWATYKPSISVAHISIGVKF